MFEKLGKLVFVVWLLGLVGLAGCSISKPLSVNFALGNPPVVDVSLSIEEFGLTLDDGAFVRGGAGVALNPLAIGKALFPKRNDAPDAVTSTGWNETGAAAGTSAPAAIIPPTNTPT